MKIENVSKALTRVHAQSIGCEQTDPLREPVVTTGTLSIVVPYTTPQLTLAALQHSAACSDLGIRVSLVDIQVVPFPCPLDQPPIDQQYSRHRLEALLTESGIPGEATVLYTRDWLQGFRRVLATDSLIVLATKYRWWPTRETKLARVLTKAGHQVMLLPDVR